MKDWCYSDRVLVHPYNALQEYSNTAKFYQQNYYAWICNLHRDTVVITRLRFLVDYTVVTTTNLCWGWFQHVDWDEKVIQYKQALEDSTAILEIQ